MILNTGLECGVPPGCRPSAAWLLIRARLSTHSSTAQSPRTSSVWPSPACAAEPPQPEFQLPQGVVHSASLGHKNHQLVAKVRLES